MTTADDKENSGHRNSGHYNSGHRNSGHYNSGHRNSGHYNSGDNNSGHRNSGHCNSGNYNSGHCNSGHFNTNSPTVRMFNKDTGLKREEISIPFLYLPVTKWVSKENMSSEEKKEHSSFYTTKGYLKELSYKEAWAEAWKECSEETKERFKSLPNFDADIFEEITGIDVRQDKCVKVEANGKTVYISKESARALGLEE